MCGVTVDAVPTDVLTHEHATIILCCFYLHPLTQAVVIMHRETKQLIICLSLPFIIVILHICNFFRGKLFCILRNRNWCLIAGVITVKTTAHWVRNSRMRFIHILHPFLLKWMLQMRKRRKSNLIRIFCNRRKFRRQCVNVIVTTWSRIYFSTCEKFQTTILDSVCRDLNSVSFAVCLWGKPHYVWHNLPITPIDLNSSKESIIQTWNWWTLKFVAQIMLKLWI